MSDEDSKKSKSSKGKAKAGIVEKVHQGARDSALVVENIIISLTSQQSCDCTAVAQTK